MATAVRFHETGDEAVLRLEDVDPGQPGPGEVLLDIAVIGVNRAELLFRRGLYLEQPRFPAGLGTEASGAILAVGDGVHGFAVGDLVGVLPIHSQNDYPVYATRALVPATSLIATPPELDAQAAAAIWTGAFTAYGGLVEIGGLKAGDTLVATAATGCNGLAAIQIGKAVGARVIATTRSAAKAETLRAQGADHVLIDGEDDIVEAVRELSHGIGAQLIFDPIAGPGVATLMEALADEGTVMLYGGLDTRPIEYPRMFAAKGGLGIRSYLARQIFGDPSRYERARAFLFDQIAKGAIRPVIDRVFPLADVREAHRYQASGAHIGKVLITTRDGA